MTDQHSDQVEATAHLTGPPPEPPAPSGGSGDRRCPDCGQTRMPEDAYCEVCGFRLAGGQMDPAAQATAGAPPVSLPSSSAAGRPLNAAAWKMEAVADRDFHHRTSHDGSSTPFPDTYQRRVLAILGERTVVGCRSVPRGIYPEIDLSGPPRDPAISSVHALLDLRPDGTLTLTDPGSAHGTWINDETRPLPRDVAVPLSDGDRIYLGSWTKLTVHRA